MNYGKRAGTCKGAWRLEPVAQHRHRATSPHRLQRLTARSHFPRKRGQTPDFLSSPACGGKWLRSEAAAGDGGTWRGGGVEVVDFLKFGARPA